MTLGERGDSGTWYREDPGFPHPCVSKFSELWVCTEWGRQTALSFPFPCLGGFPPSPPNANTAVQEQRPAFPTRARTPARPQVRKGARTHFLREGRRSFSFPNGERGSCASPGCPPDVLMSCKSHPWLALPHDLLWLKASLSFRNGALGCLRGFHLQGPHGCRTHT